MEINKPALPLASDQRLLAVLFQAKAGLPICVVSAFIGGSKLLHSLGSLGVLGGSIELPGWRAGCDSRPDLL